MTSSTRRLTSRAEAIVGEPLSLAVRVRQGPAQRTAKPAEATGSGSGLAVPRSFPVMGLPILPLLRSLKHGVTDLWAGDDVVKAVLALTRAGDRVLVDRSRFRSLRPTRIIRRLPVAAPVKVDLSLLYEHLIPELDVDGERYLVNAVDFGVLTRAAVTGELHAPELAEQLRPYYETVQALATSDPRTIRALLRQQGPTV